MRAILAALASALILIAPALEAGATRGESQRYEYGAAGDVIPVCRGEILLNFSPVVVANPGGNVGGGCFRVLPTDRIAFIRLADDQWGPIGGNYVFTSVTGQIRSQGFVCPSAAQVAVPELAAHLRVWVNGPKSAAVHCNEAGRFGTSGTITVDLSE